MSILFRWRLAAVMMIFITSIAMGCWMDVRFLIEYRAEKTIRLNQLAEKKKVLARFMRQMPVQQKKFSYASISEFISDLQSILQRSGLIAQTLTLSSYSEHELPETLNIQLNAIGRFQQGAEFIQALALLPISVAVRSYSYQPQTASGKAVWRWELQAFMSVPSSRHQSKWRVHDSIFCGESQALKDSRLNQAATVPVKKLKIIGYLADGDRQAVLVSTPANDVTLAARGDIIGSEHALITNVSPKQITLLMPNNKNMIMNVE